MHKFEVFLEFYLRKKCIQMDNQTRNKKFLILLLGCCMQLSLVVSVNFESTEEMLTTKKKTLKKKGLAQFLYWRVPRNLVWAFFLAVFEHFFFEIFQNTRYFMLISLENDPKRFEKLFWPSLMLFQLMYSKKQQ